MILKNFLLLLCLLIAFTAKLQGQTTEGDSLKVKAPTDNYTFKWQQLVLPVSIISAGSVALAPNFVRRSSRHVTRRVISFRGEKRRLKFDDYIQYIPLASTLSLGFVGVKARHSLRDRLLITATASAALATLTNIPKYCIDEKRPEFAGRNSFTSGHTATAFMGAELVRIEYGGWYGTGAYAVATTVGFMRMYNGRHWLKDVVAGAGVGILSARIGEWSAPLWQKLFHKKEKLTPAFTLMPIAAPMQGGYYGMTLGCCF